MIAWLLSAGRGRVGTGHPGKEDASVLSQIPCTTTSRRRYLCNPFCYSRTLLLLLHMSDRTCARPTRCLGSGLLNCAGLSIPGMRTLCTIHSTYSPRHRAGLLGVLHGWVGMQPASRHAPTSDPALASDLHAILSCRRRLRLGSAADGLAAVCCQRQPRSAVPCHRWSRLPVIVFLLTKCI
jgi:hypothetical protein